MITTRNAAKPPQSFGVTGQGPEAVAQHRNTRDQQNSKTDRADRDRYGLQRHHKNRQDSSQFEADEPSHPP